MQRKDHVREAGKLEKHKENELAGEMLPQELAGASVVELLLGLRPLHGVHHQVHQLVLQHWAALLVLWGREWTQYSTGFPISPHTTSYRTSVYRQAEKHGVRQNPRN